MKGIRPSYQTQVIVSHSFKDDLPTTTDLGQLHQDQPRMTHVKKLAYASLFVLLWVVAAAALFSPIFSEGNSNSIGVSPQALLIAADIINVDPTQEHFDAASSVTTDEPLSYMSPEELNIPIYNDRPHASRPGEVFASVQQGAAIHHPLPTNAWFLNLLVGLREDDHDDSHFSAPENRVYAIPYIVDTAGTIVGIRLHFPHILCWGTGVQSSFVDRHGLTLGTADASFSRKYTVDGETLPNKLGVGIRWENKLDSSVHMRSSILRGMPYGTMQYSPGVIPAIASEIALKSLPIIDSNLELACATLDPSSSTAIRSNSTGPSILVKNDVQLHFAESDFTWLVFFSRPVYVKCFVNPHSTMATISLPPGSVSAVSAENQNAFVLQVDLTKEEQLEDKPVIVRIALANNCTTGTNANYCQQGELRDKQEFTQILRDHADIYPSDPSVSYAYSSPVTVVPDTKSAYIYFDWSPRSMKADVLDYMSSLEESQNQAGKWWARPQILGASKQKTELLMYALPHHIDIMRPIADLSSNSVVANNCVQSLHGNACLLLGGKWAMEENLDGPPNFMADRPPNHRAIPALANALLEDVHYSIPENYMRGAGDTYFSGKMLAKLGRIIVIASELRGLAETPNYDLIDLDTEVGMEEMRIVNKCKNVDLPTEAEMDDAIARLRSGVEIWLNGTAQSKFVYDNTWGGIVNCGCWFNGETQSCDNEYPDCPSFTDPGLNFGNGFYNDHHFHYGYHIAAAAVVANYDRNWGRQYFEQVLLLIRDIANPSIKDKYFPSFRQKDWYLGNSWASGIATVGGRPYLNGRNQESSSEAIAAYEGIAMYGAVMVEAWGAGRSSDPTDTKNSHTASRVRDLGRLLTATELRSADRYWHVWHGNDSRNIYPKAYSPAVVGMMWDMMAQFQTWFGNAPYLAYGIQLLPLTPVSERRDNEQWARQLYPPFSQSCEESPDCTDQGWSILQYAILSTVGHKELAIKKTLEIPKESFMSAGGSGHSLSNTLWYLSTRPDTIPLDLENPSTTTDSVAAPASDALSVDCGCPRSCTEAVLNRDADGFTCKARMQWLIQNHGSTELQACKVVGGDEFPIVCGACNPGVCADNHAIIDVNSEDDDVVSNQCPPCSKEVCQNAELNRCQVSTTPFLCHTGPSRGGCSARPWVTNKVQQGFCFGCCELYAGCEK